MQIVVGFVFQTESQMPPIETDAAGWHQFTRGDCKANPLSKRSGHRTVFVHMHNDYIQSLSQRLWMGCQC